MKLILPESMGAPTVPESFLRGLHAIDPALVIYWNRFKQRFIIDRCIRGNECSHAHNCERTNILIVETPEHLFMMPSDWTLDRIKAMDAWTNYGTLENQRKTRENAKADWDAKQKATIADNYAHAQRDGKQQLNQAVTLIERHDMNRIH